MVRTGVIVLFCAAMNVMTEAQMDTNARELYNLHNWRDLCSVELIPGFGAAVEGKRRKSSVKVGGVQALDLFCSNAFEGWESLVKEGAAQLKQQCPQAKDPKCRVFEGAKRCTVRIQASNKSDIMKTVALRSCIEGFEWDGILKKSGVDVDPR